MGRKSVRENKNIYQLSRESAGLTREEASEEMVYISDDRIEKIESDKSLPHPDEVMTMSECYKKADLCNYYCSNECPIGQKYVPQLELKNLQQITLEVLNALNTVNNRQARLIEIAVDGKISSDEKDDFLQIINDLSKIAVSAQTLRLWLEHARYQNETGEQEYEN